MIAQTGELTRRGKVCCGVTAALGIPFLIACGVASDDTNSPGVVAFWRLVAIALGAVLAATGLWTLPQQELRRGFSCGVAWSLLVVISILAAGAMYVALFVAY